MSVGFCARSELGWLWGGRPTPRKLWALWKDGRLECERNEHPLGCDVRFYVRGELFYSRVHGTVELAEAEANERRRDRMSDGWIGPPSTAP